MIIDRGFYPTGSIGAGSAIVSGGEIGDASLGTALSVADSNDGIVAAIGVIRLANGPLGGYVFNDVGATPGNPNAAAIDAIFTNDGQPLELGSSQPTTRRPDPHLGRFGRPPCRLQRQSCWPQALTARVLFDNHRPSLPDPILVARGCAFGHA